MNENYKVIVAHPAQQHSYKTAIALKKSGYLHKYVTTVYKKEQSLTSFITRFINGDNLIRANSRRSEELEDEDVLQFYELRNLILLFLQRVDKTKFFYNRWQNLIIKAFNRKLANYVIKKNIDAIIVYDTMSYLALEILKKRAPNVKLIIDMSAPNLLFMDMIFKDDLKKNNEYQEILKDEVNTSLYNKTLKMAKKEIDLADFFLVASSFSERSLLHYGISPDKIYKFPYGIDSNYYDNTKLIKTRDSRKKLNIIFVGRVTQKKGAFYLFEAIRMMDLKLFTFKFAGSYDENSKYYKDFRDICTFVGHVTKEEIINLYRESDILVFPSLADGFGLSVLEALSFGIPVICSDNAGASDLIINGYNGYVVSTGVESEIYDKLIWFNNNRDKLQEMSINARKSAAELTWEKYNQNVKNAIKKIME